MSGPLSRPHHERIPIEQKESNKWLEGNQMAEKYLQDAKEVILIQDREGDIYEQFAQTWSDNIYLLIRSRWNRDIGAEQRLLETLAAEPVAGHYSTFLSADSHRKTAARDAVFEVRITRCQLRRPERKRGPWPDKSAWVYAINAKEITAGVSEPVDWTLLRTWPVAGFTAVQVIWWYQCRWMIEEIFGALKQECFDIEGSELEQGWAIRRLCLMIPDTVIKLFGMQVAYNTEEGAEPSDVQLRGLCGGL